MVRKPITGWKRTALNLFIAWHLAIILFWGMPESPLRNRLARPFEKYVVYSGLWHVWGMFAPMPLIVHFDVRAAVKRKDGKVDEWIAPRMEELSIWQRAPKERFRKWREKIRTEEFRSIWPETARFIAREMNSDPGNPPVEVKMTRYWVNLPRPNLNSDYQPMPSSFTPTNSYTFATVAIRPEDLQ